MTELENKIIEASQAYYSGNAIITDAEWDNLIDELRVINPNSEVFNKIGWGYQVQGEKARHKYQTVGSLSKAREFKQINDTLLKDVIISAKMDGISAVLYYVDGKLQYALTRGNGTEGKVITDKIKKIKGVKKLMPEFTGAIRGELIIDNEKWDEYVNNVGEYKNSRNAVAGIINKDDIDDTLNYVSFIPYNILGIEHMNEYVLNNMLRVHETDTQFDVLRYISFYFGKCVPYLYIKEINDTDVLKKFYDTWSKIYPIDGVVITSNKLSINNSVVTYNQQAFKFQSERKYSKVTNIDWNLTKTNKLVPTIEIEPIDLAGATITRVTAFNAKYVGDNHICVGATVEIERSGEVIPKIIRVVDTPDTTNSTIPTVCPICGNTLVLDGVDLVCNSVDCPNIDYRDLQQWVNIIGETDGIGDTLMFKFLDSVNINNIDDLYSSDWLNKITDTGVQVTKFITAMRKVLYESVNIETALKALNIPRFGKVTCSKISNDTSLCKMLVSDAISGYLSDKTKLGIVNLVGIATANSVAENMRRLSKLKYISDRIIYKEAKEEKGKVAITGKLSMKRADFEKLLADNGYTVSTLTKDTMYLITDDPNSGSSKNVKADKLGIKKITESEMLSIING